MKHLRLFENFNENDINSICKEYGITNYTINEDGSIDVDDDVYCNWNKELTKLPLRFGNVSGDFNCNDNQLRSLEGCPESIGGNFVCRDNQLTSLEGSPENIIGYFNCNRNQLRSLEGCPRSIGGGFYCNYNQLRSLEGCPSIGGDFYCRNNNITSFEGLPDYIGGQLYCHNNPIYEIWKLFRDYSKIELFNDYDIIRGTDIVLYRLNSFLDEIGKDPVEKVKGYNII